MFLNFCGNPDKRYEGEIVNILLPINLTFVLGAQKNNLIETDLLSTHNICFGTEIRKIIIFVCCFRSSKLSD